MRRADVRVCVDDGVVTLGMSSGRVRVTVSDRVVCLEGTVDRLRDADDACAAAKAVDGVATRRAR